MSKGFWENLPRPFFALAPMADVTDFAFRRMFAEEGKPDVLWTEFVSADGLCSVGREHLLPILRYRPDEHPIVVQLFGSNPRTMEEAAEFVASLGFDGIDINMGCPDRSVEKGGAGAALIRDPKRAVDLIAAAKQGAGAIPVSVKTRVGYAKEELDTWIGTLLSASPAAITVHARTRKEMSLVPAQWDYVRRAAMIARGTGTLIIGNGDVVDLSDARRKAEETGADGIMIGRGAFGKPWLFKRDSLGVEPTVKVRLRAMVRHTRYFEEYLSGVKPFAVMKKHYKAYANGFTGAKELRALLMECETADHVEGVVNRFLDAQRP